MSSIPADIHSFSNPNEVLVRHVSLHLEVLFSRKTLLGTAVLSIEHGNATARELILDTRALQIDETEVSRDGLKYLETRFELGKPDAILGTALKIQIEPQTKYVRIRYSTSPSATALQWLAPEQTADKLGPFLYSQGEAIHTRSWIPLQDSPGVRVTYDARVKTPAGTKAVMSATNCPDSADCHFKMEQPIPPYLIAIAVGNLKFQPVSARTGVWAEPSVLAKAAAEFADMEKMLLAAEKLYGPYRWERYDVLVLPPSFPFGGMENPRLTFATPTILAGDKSLVSLVAHELAHSWSGNLVTNATWSDFWLNEGYTVYIERRILEELYGKRRAEMETSLGYDELAAEMKGAAAVDQILHVDLKGRDPDDGATSVPYEKGALFLRAIEDKVGREKFDAYLRAHFDHFAFQSVTTRTALDFLTATLGDTVDFKTWVYQPGLPAVKPASEAFVEIDKAIGAWEAGRKIETSQWCTQEWQHFLGGLTKPVVSKTELARLDEAFHFTDSKNDEILAQWLLLAVKGHYAPADNQLALFMTTVGRRKYIKPLYEALDVERARTIYDNARPGYHAILQQTIDGMLKYDRRKLDKVTEDFLPK